MKEMKKAVFNIAEPSLAKANIDNPSLIISAATGILPANLDIELNDEQTPKNTDPEGN